MVAIGSDAKREVEDMHLSRHACYRVVQNADPAIEVVALGQTHTARVRLGYVGTAALPYLIFGQIPFRKTTALQF